MNKANSYPGEAAAHPSAAVEAVRIAADRLWLFLDGAYRDGAARA